MTVLVTKVKMLLVHMGRMAYHHPCNGTTSTNQSANDYSLLVIENNAGILLTINYPALKRLHTSATSH